jgi:hypothetical protein
VINNCSQFCIRIFACLSALHRNLFILLRIGYICVLFYGIWWCLDALRLIVGLLYERCWILSFDLCS